MVWSKTSFKTQLAGVLLHNAEVAFISLRRCQVELSNDQRPFGEIEKFKSLKLLQCLASMIQ